MGTFDSERFNGFARQSLDNLLFSDFWGHDIFNERDLHSSAHFYIRDYFRRRERDEGMCGARLSLLVCAQT